MGKFVPILRKYGSEYALMRFLYAIVRLLKQELCLYDKSFFIPVSKKAWNWSSFIGLTKYRITEIDGA